MGSVSRVQSVVERNIVMRRIPLINPLALEMDIEIVASFM